MEIQIDFDVAKWSLLLDPKYRYIFIKGGRMSGKSHGAADYLIERSITETDLKIVCLREFQASLDKSSKSVIDTKLKKRGLSRFYKSIEREIRKVSPRDDGNFYFIGMNDLTADSVKSLEGYKIAWFEEAQNCTENTLKTLRPTINRVEGAQLIFTWNPKFPDDPIEKFCDEMRGEDDVLIIHVNYNQNPFLGKSSLEEIERDKIKFPHDFGHVYLGEYDTSFHGHYYAPLILEAENQGRICEVPRKHGVDVITAWDLGRSDKTAIWVAQIVGLQPRIIDYVEDQFKDLDFYVKWIKERGYNGAGDVHWLPHDSNHERLGMTGSIKSQVIEMGLINVEAPLQAAGVEGGRSLVKSLIKECYFDKERCKEGIHVLKKEGSVWDARKNQYKETHELDGAAAFRYLAQALTMRTPVINHAPSIKRDLRRSIMC